jgi:hypothetical protein
MLMEQGKYQTGHKTEKGKERERTKRKITRQEV